MNQQRLYEMVRDVCGELNASFMRERESVNSDASLYRVYGKPVAFSGLELRMNGDEKSLRQLVEHRIRSAVS